MRTLEEFESVFSPSTTWYTSVLLQKFKRQKFSKQEVSRRLSFELQTFLLGGADRLQCGFSDGYALKPKNRNKTFLVSGI